MGWGVSVSGLAPLINFLRSVQFEFSGDVTYVVGPTVEYAVYHELGTSKMKARPFARPAAQRVQSNPARAEEFLDAGSVLEAGEEELVKATALAVEQEMIRIITQKGLVDSGTMRASVGIERVN